MLRVRRIELSKGVPQVSGLCLLCAETSEGSNQCRGGDAAVAGHVFFAQLLFKRIDIELAFPDDPLGNGTRHDRSKGFNDPSVVEAIASAAHRVFGTAIGALESRFYQQIPKPGPHVGTCGISEES